MMSGRTRTLSLLILSTCVASSSTHADVFVFNDFADLSSFTLNGATGSINPGGTGVLYDGQRVLRLTNNFNQGGSAFLTNQVSLGGSASFNTFFIFQITSSGGISDGDGVGADGLVFVIQTQSNNVGSFGQGIGYQGIAPSVGVEFDTWNNGGCDGNNGNHVGIDINGSVCPSVAQVNIPTRMNDGNRWYAWVDYFGPSNQLEVRLSQTIERPVSPILTRTVNLASVLGSNTAYVGFTSGTGSATGNHDIRFWRFEDACQRLATFDEFVSGTTITDQYRTLGLLANMLGGTPQIFTADPGQGFVAVSGSQLFGQPIGTANPTQVEFTFVVPNTITRAATSYFSCFVVDAESIGANLTAYDPNGSVIFNHDYHGGNGAQELAVITAPAIARVVATLGHDNDTAAIDNICLSEPFSITSPDLQIDSIALPSAGHTVEQVSASFRVRNAGDAAANGTWVDRVYLSSDSQPGGDQLIAEIQHGGPLAPGTYYDQVVQVTLPATPGNYWLVVNTDGANNVTEIPGENNNARVSESPVVVTYPPAPDLVVSNIIVPSTGLAGQSFELHFIVMNTGNAAASGSWSDQVLFSADNQIGGDMSVGNFAFSGVFSPGAAYEQIIPISLPGAPGNYYVVVKTDSDNAVPEQQGESNNSSISATAINVQPFPMPDLIVTLIVPPSSGIISGTTATVSWTVQNIGTAPTSASQWVDEIRVSANPSLTFGGPGGDQQICFDPIPPIHVGNPSYLEPGDSFVQSANIAIPHNITGPYYIYVIADRPGCRMIPGSVAETSDTNNLLRSSQFSITLEPQPDLQATQLSFSANAFSATNFTVNWVDRNVGTGSTSTGTWTDKVFLSTNQSTSTAGDLLLGQRVRSGSNFAPGASDPIASLMQLLPASLSGARYVKVVVDANNSVPEIGLEDNNTLVSASQVNIVLSPSPDLVATQVTPSTNGIPAHPIQVTYSAHNQGAPPPTGFSWVDKVYLSADATLEPNTDILLGSVSKATTYDNGQFAIADYIGTANGTLPSTLTAGQYYVIVAVDAADQVFEASGENNNVLASAPFQVQLVPTDLQIVPDSPGNPVPSSGAAGQPIPVQWQVTNTGQAATPIATWSDAVYLSIDSTLGASDTFLNSTPHSGALSSNNSYVGQATITIPSGMTPGSYYLLFVADSNNNVFEQAPGESNNVAASVFTVTPPTVTYVADLTPIELSGPETLRPGEQFTVQFTVRNVGNAATIETGWIDRLYLSTDGILGSEDVLLGSVTHTGSLASQETFVASGTFVAPPSGGGSYYIILRTDAAGQVFEADESNNLRLISTNFPGPPVLAANLVVSSVSASGATIAGQDLSVTWTIANTGEAPTNVGSWRDSIFLSLDSNLSPDDVLVGSYQQNVVLNNGDSREATQSFTVPSSVTTGTYYVIVLTDSQNAVQENGRENDNSGVAAAMTQIQGIPPANLIAQNIVAPTNAAAGQSLSLSWTTANNGPGPTPTGVWNDAVFLSRDLILNPAVDVYLGGFTHNGVLAAGAQQAIDQNYDVPPGLSGPYFVFVKADYNNQVAETSNSDNVSYSANMVQITLPSPGDLVVSSVSASGSYMLGDMANFSWQITNNGPGTISGGWSDSIYLSADSVWDINDSFVGRFLQPSVTLAQGQSAGGSGQAAIPAVAPGNYYVIVRTDVFNQIPETNNANNTGASAGTLMTTIRPLKLGVPFTGALPAGAGQYFSLTVPAGETIHITLNHSSPTGWTEVYVRKGTVPTLGQFDIISGNPDQPNQLVTIPTTEAATYYIMARATYGTYQPGGIDMTIQANAIPFGIESVLPPRVGNGQSVTLRIQGSRFDAGTTVELHGLSGLVLTPIAVTVMNGEHLRARFNLSAAPFGPYDVVLIASGGQQATLTNGITVEPAAPISVGISGSGDLTPRVGGVFLVNGILLNSGNIDAEYVIVIVQFHGNVFIGWNRPVGTLPPMLGEGIWNWGANSPTTSFHNGLTVDSFYVKNLAPGEQLNFSTIVSQYSSGPFEFQISSQVLNNVSFASILADRIETVRQYLLNVIGTGCLVQTPELGSIVPDENAWRTHFGEIFQQLGFIDSPLPSGAAFNCNGFIPCAATLLGDELIPNPTCFDCAWLAGIPVIGLELAGACKLYEIGQTLNDAWHCYHDNCHPMCQECVDGENVWKPCSFFDVIGSYFSNGTTACGQGQNPIDPNEKAGPTGYDDMRFVSAQPLGYTVFFENVPSATAAAATITIHDLLDPSLNIGSVRLGSMHIGDISITVPPNRISYQTTLDLVATKGILLDVTGGVNAATREVFWIFKSIDPATGDTPANPNLGILPPNDATGRGQGHVEYTVKPNSSAVTGAVIQNSASIVFDTQPPIVTNTWTNTLDVDPPNSAVVELPAMSVDPNISLTWSGNDAPGGSGLANYSVYVSRNSAHATPFLTDVADQSGTFVGEPGRQYAFYSIAKDNAGNFESPPTSPDATTIVPLDTPGAATVVLHTATTIRLALGADQGTIPNPADAKYAIVEVNSGQYIGTNGRLTATPAAQTRGDWTTTIVVRALQPGTTYVFAVKATNEFGESVLGPSVSATTQIQGDVNGDGHVSQTDVSLVQAALGTQYGQPGFDPAADLNGDNRVTFVDLAIVRNALPCPTAGSGDFDSNGVTNAGDIPLLVNELLNPTPAGICIGDVNEDAAFDGRDIQSFVVRIMG